MSRARRLLLIAIIVLLAAALRGLAVARLPVDFDEPVYYGSGLAYAAAIRAGDLTAAADPAPEHPALVKLLYAAVLLSPSLRQDPLPNPLPVGEGTLSPSLREGLGEGGEGTEIPLPALWWVRGASAAFGVAHVLLLAVASPAAGALLAIHSYTVKYTAQIYLEALPMFTATVCVLSYMAAVEGSRKERQEGKERQKGFSWRSSRSLREPLLFWTLSAVALGLTAAGKYVYAVAGLAVAADWLWGAWAARRPGRLLGLAAWGGLALLVFFAANPVLWPAPAARLWASLAFHAGYSQSAHVAQSGYPWYQLFVWLLAPLPAQWHPGIIVTPLDTLTALLGAVGAVPLWRRGGRVLVLWWLIGLGFTLLWSTKWPQYSLIMTAPMCLCAVEGLRMLWTRLAGGKDLAPGRQDATTPGIG